MIPPHFLELELYPDSKLITCNICYTWRLKMQIIVKTVPSTTKDNGKVGYGGESPSFGPVRAPVK
jgi:hypothetical protein